MEEDVHVTQRRGNWYFCLYSCLRMRILRKHLSKKKEDQTNIMLAHAKCAVTQHNLATSMHDYLLKFLWDTLRDHSKGSTY